MSGEQVRTVITITFKNRIDQKKKIESENREEKLTEYWRAGYQLQGPSRSP